MAFDLGRGEMIFFGGCILHAIYGPLVKKFNRGESVVVFTFWTLVACTFWIALYGYGDVIKTRWTSLPDIVWITIGYLAVFTTAGTFFLLQYALMRLPASKVLAYGYLTPSVIIIFEGLVGHGWAGLSVAIGAVVTILGLIIIGLAPDQ
jgi:drug/metabolite transporter (DMT)-like permease